MKRILPLILVLCPLAGAQTTVIVPAPDGKTIVSNSNVWSCVAGLPAGMNFDGTTLTVPKVSTAELDLTGGTAYKDGLYNVSLTGGVSSLVPVIPLPTPTPGKTYTVVLPTTSGTSWTLVPGLTLVNGQQVTVTAVNPHTGPPVTSDWFYYSTPRVQPDSAGAVYVGLSNATSTAITKAQVTVVVK